jgi:hypothetical protein
MIVSLFYRHFLCIIYNHWLGFAVPSDWYWHERLEATSDSLSLRTQLLSVRRAILSLCSLPSHLAQQWLSLTHALRRLGRFDAARVSLRSAEQSGLDSEQALLEECRILREQGFLQKALMLLEPGELDLEGIQVTKLFCCHF